MSVCLSSFLEPQLQKTRPRPTRGPVSKHVLTDRLKGDGEALEPHRPVIHRGARTFLRTLTLSKRNRKKPGAFPAAKVIALPILGDLGTAQDSIKDEKCLRWVIGQALRSRRGSNSWNRLRPAAFAA